MRIVKHIVSLVLLSFSICLSQFAVAASVVTMSVKEMTAVAQDISVVRCKEVKSYWHKNKIYTDSTFTVLENVKGRAVNKQLVITTLGGSAIHPRLKAPVSMQVPGGLSFLVDEESLVFTVENSNKQRQVVGLTQGKFVIAVDQTSGEKIIPVGKKILTNKQETKNAIDQLFSPFSDLVENDLAVQVRNMELEELIDIIRKDTALTATTKDD